MMPGGRRASAPATAGRRPESTALLPPAVPPRRASARLGRGGARAGPPAEALVRRSVVEPLVSCGICGGLLRDATAFSECLDAFCRECIYDKFAKENIKCCPTCGVNLGCTPLEKLRSLIFSTKTKRRKVVTTKSKKRNGMISSESILSSVVDIVAEGSTAPQPPAASQSEAQNMEVEVIDEPDEALIVQESVFEPSILNLAPVGRDALSRIRCRDFYSVCHLSAETGALIVWQPPLVLEEMVSYDHLAPRQDPESFGPPATSDTKYQRQAPAVEMTVHPRMTVQDDENLRGDILALFNESNARIMGRYDAYISQLKAENSRLKKDLENERAAALERTRIIEEGHRRELEKERAAAAERTRIVEERLQRELEDEREAVIMSMRILEERLQRESQSAKSTRRQNRSLEAEIARLYEELENGRADNQALMSDILEKSDELATLKYHADMFESDNTDLENQVEHLKKELEYAKKEHARYVRQVLDAARAIPNDLETGTSDLA